MVTIHKSLRELAAARLPELSHVMPPLVLVHSTLHYLMSVRGLSVVLDLKCDRVPADLIFNKPGYAITIGEITARRVNHETHAISQVFIHAKDRKHLSLGVAVVRDRITLGRAQKRLYTSPNTIEYQAEQQGKQQGKQQTIYRAELLARLRTEADFRTSINRLPSYAETFVDDIRYRTINVEFYDETTDAFDREYVL